MGFTTPVFILKNTPELRDKLVRLGYKIGYERYINDDFLATDNDEMFGIDVHILLNNVMGIFIAELMRLCSLP